MGSLHSSLECAFPQKKIPHDSKMSFGTLPIIPIYSQKGVAHFTSPFSTLNTIIK